MSGLIAALKLAGGLLQQLERPAQPIACSTRTESRNGQIAGREVSPLRFARQLDDRGGLKVLVCHRHRSCRSG
jgi:hypothetical protein